MSATTNRHQEPTSTGGVLATRARELLRRGNTGRLSLRRRTGEELVGVSLTSGAAVAAAGVVLAPALVAGAAVAALLSGVTVGVELPAVPSVPR